MQALKDIAHIAGRPGLFRIVKPGRSGVIVESLNEQKKREIVNVHAKVSILSDISIYTEDYEKSTPLSELFATIKEKHGEQVEFDIKNSAPQAFFDWFADIMPDFDRERVYHSDIKKVIQWYNTLSKEAPETFNPSEEEKEA